MKDKKDKLQIYFHSRLWSYLPRVPILVEDTVYIFIGVAYFNHAANLYWITEEEKKKVTLNHLTDCINRSKFLSVG